MIGVDGVDDFLFDMCSGFCVYYVGVMVFVLCVVGIFV